MFELTQDNAETFRLLIANYESVIEELHQELYFLKDEQDNLKKQLSEVLKENSKLSQDLQSALTPPKQSNQTENSQDIIANLKEQINTLITEKEYLSKLWQEGIKTVDRLEDELKLFQSGYESFVPKKNLQTLKITYEEKIGELEIKLATAEKKLNDAKVKHSEIDQSLENQASAMKIVKNLESEVLKLQKRLQASVEERDLVKQNLQKKDDVIQSLKKANADYLNRVAEAVSIVEAALNEKDAALFREQGIKEENEKLVAEMTEIVKQTQEKIKQESIKINMEHNAKQKSIIEELNKAQNEIRNRSLENEALSKQCALLEKEIDRIHSGHCKVEESDMNKLLLLEKNLETTFQKLLVSEKLNIQLTSDKEVMKNDLDQMASIYERNLKAKEVEILTFKSKINRLETELNESYEKVNNLTERMLKLNQQIENTEKEFKEQKGHYEIDMKINYEEKIKEYKGSIKELQTQIEKKQELHQKWRKESKTITENLEKLVINLKQEIQNLKKDNKLLKENFKKSEDKVRQYKAFLELISKDVNKISHLTLGTEVS